MQWLYLVKGKALALPQTVDKKGAGTLKTPTPFLI
jgi:hypothetical protein